jgi:multiple sugar transport system permease protein
VFLAALQGVPRHLHEAAVIDGAGPLRRFMAVTFPMISPATFFLLVTNTIGALQVFAQSYLMTKGTGEPEDSTLFLVFHLFRKGFIDFNMGNAAAMAWIIFAVVLVATAVQFQLAKFWVHDESR